MNVFPASIWMLEKNLSSAEVSFPVSICYVALEWRTAEKYMCYLIRIMCSEAPWFQTVGVKEEKEAGPTVSTVSTTSMDSYQQK